MTSKPNSIRIRVYYEDTDCGNVVYYANYLKYMERGRTEYMRELEIDVSEYHRKGFMFAVIEANMKYRASAHYNDLLFVETKVKEVTSVSMTFTTDILNDSRKLLVVGDVKLACINQLGKACRIPAEIVEKIKQ